MRRRLTAVDAVITTFLLRAGPWVLGAGPLFFNELVFLLFLFLLILAGYLIIGRCELDLALELILVLLKDLLEVFTVDVGRRLLELFLLLKDLYQTLAQLTLWWLSYALARLLAYRCSGSCLIMLLLWGLYPEDGLLLHVEESWHGLVIVREQLVHVFKDSNWTTHSRYYLATIWKETFFKKSHFEGVIGSKQWWLGVT